MPVPKLTADQLKRLARRLVNRLGGRIPPAILQQLVSNPPFLRLLVEEMGMLIGAAAHRDVIATLLRAGRTDLANVVAYRVDAKRGGDGPPLPSKTGMRLREDLGKLPQFAKFTDDAWVHLGNHVKKYGDTRIVFTGALQTLLAHAYRKGKALPMTEDYGVRWMPKDSYAMKMQYADRYLAWLDDAGIVEKTDMPAREALRANHTKKDEAVAKQNPDMPITVYVAGETLPGIIALLGRYGAKLGAVATAATAPELVQLREAERLPVGSVVVPWANGRPDTSAFLVVVKGGALPRAVLPPKAGLRDVEDGTPLAEWGAKEWAVLKKGTGKVPTKPTVDRTVMTWWRGLTASVVTAGRDWVKKDATDRQAQAGIYYSTMNGEFLVIVGPVNPRYKVRPIELYRVEPDGLETFLGYVAPDKMRNIPRERALDAGKGVDLLQQKNLDPAIYVAKPLTPSQQEKVRQRIRKKASACIAQIVFFSSKNRWREAEERGYPNNTLFLLQRYDGMWLARYKHAHGTSSTTRYVKGPLAAALIALSKAVPDGPCKASAATRVHAGKLKNAHVKFVPIPYEKVYKEYVYGPSARDLRLKSEGKGKLTKTEQGVLNRISTALRSTDVIALGWISRALQYGHAVKRLKKAEMNALFSLLAKGAVQFGVVETNVPVLGKALGLPENFGQFKPQGFHGGRFYALMLPGKSLPSEPTIEPDIML